MMTVRQIRDVCRKGYIYDIEHDRFISKEEDDRLYRREYGVFKKIKNAWEWIASHKDEIRKALVDYSKLEKEGRA